MNKRTLILRGISCPAAMVAVSLVAIQVAAADADLAAGQKLFKTDCVVCHKADGEGGVKLGKATSADLRAPDLEDTYKTDAAIAAAILDGKDEDGKDLDTVMPRWHGKISDTQVADLIAYLKTLKK